MLTQKEIDSSGQHREGYDFTLTQFRSAVVGRERAGMSRRTENLIGLILVVVIGVIYALVLGALSQ